MPTTVRVRTVTAVTQHEKGRIASALAAAFYEDPIFEWLYPDDEARRGVMKPFFDIFTDAIAHHGVSQLAGDGAGATLWVPPGEKLVEDEDAEAFFNSIDAFSPTPADTERLAGCFEAMEAAHPTERCWYLNFIGVAPEEQGTGIGSALLRSSLERVDRDGVPAYLEATSEHNRRLYERFGFEVVGEIPMPGGPSMWPMWREPSPD
jgi:GNAT superfamily N-acetyltransferase